MVQLVPVSPLASPSAAGAGSLLEGIALVAGGIIMILWGVALWRNSWNITSRYYDMTIRSWRRIPILGYAWIRMTPFIVFRLECLVPAMLVGAVLIFAGITVIFGPAAGGW